VALVPLHGRGMRYHGNSPPKLVCKGRGFPWGRQPRTEYLATNQTLKGHLAMQALWSRLVSLIAGEWILDGRPNGGDIIVARSLFASVLLYLIYIAVKHGLDPNRIWSFSGTELQKEAHNSLPIWGALLAAVYASLYARFAAQWSYLAGLYNKLVEAEMGVTGAETVAQREALAYWIASFIEDAEDLHLSTKRMFAPAIRGWLDQPDVRAAYLAGTIGAQQRLQRLEVRLARLLPPTAPAQAVA
jgi:hypothetical protein